MELYKTGAQTGVKNQNKYEQTRNRGSDVKVRKHEETLWLCFDGPINLGLTQNRWTQSGNKEMTAKWKQEGENKKTKKPQTNTDIYLRGNGM